MRIKNLIKNIRLLSLGSALALIASDVAGQDNKPETSDAQTNPTFTHATYINIHYQNKRFSAGGFAGPYLDLKSSKVSSEFNLYAGIAPTGEQTPIRIDVVGTLGITSSRDHKEISFQPEIQISPNLKNEKHALLNNFYFSSSTPLKGGQPTLTVGYALPIGGGGSKKTSVYILEELRRLTP